MKNVIQKLLNALIVYIPLLIMALLAGVTWWLVVITPGAPDIVVRRTKSANPDLEVYNFTAKRFDASGTMRSSLIGDVARQYPLTNTIVIDHVNLMTTETSFKENNIQPLLGTAGIEFFRTTAISDTGIIYNADSIIEFLDNAYITRQPLNAQGNSGKIEFWGNELKILVDENIMVSTQPVDIRRDGTRYTAQGMTFNNNTGILEMRGKVDGTISLE